MHYMVVIVVLLAAALFLKPLLALLRQAIIRAFHGVLAGAIVGGGLGLGVGAITGEEMMGTGFAVLLGVPVAVLTFLYLLWRDGRDALEVMEAATCAPRPSIPAPPPPAPEPDPEPAADKAVREAWTKALALAPQAETKRLTRARKSCAALLDRFDMGQFALDPKTIDHVHLIRERLPSLVRSAEQKARNASPDYRTHVLRRMVEHLLDFGTIAEALLSSAVPSTEDWEVLDAHLANRLGDAAGKD